MFGYVTANKNELKEDDAALYQAYYCGLCRELKRQAGKRGQLLLNYDLTFLAILLSGLYEPEEEIASFTCGLHPSKRKQAVESEAVRYAASMDILLSYYNLLDDWKDDGNRTRKKLADGLLPLVDKVRSTYRRQADAVEGAIARLDEAEHRKEENTDAVSAITGELLGAVFQWKEDDVWNRELQNMGFYLGKFIYLMDAWIDLEEDEAKGRYNPFILMRERSPRCIDTLARQVLVTQIGECARIFERLPVLKNASLIRNILYSGVWTRYDLKKLKEEKKAGRNR